MVLGNCVVNLVEAYAHEINEHNLKDRPVTLHRKSDPHARDQGDVWKLYEAGIKNAVGLFGKDLSESQKNLLIQSGVSDIVILTDNDQAGREGRMKIQRELSRMFNLIYPPMLKKDVGDMTVEQIKEYILPHVEGLY